MKTALQSLLICLLTGLILTIPALAGAPAPSQRLAAERKAFMENQISDENKLFLDALGERLQDLAELNGAASRLFQSISVAELRPAEIDSILKKNSRNALLFLAGPGKAVENLKLFSREFFTGNDIADLLDGITESYEHCLNISQNIDAYSEHGGAPSGSFYYFEIRINSFEKAFDERIPKVLEDASRKYIQLYPLTKEHNIQRLHSESQTLGEYFQEADSLLQKEVIDPLELSNQTWLNAAYITATELVEKHYRLNYAFAEATKQKLAGIQIPRQPESADLTVPFIEIIVPKNVKRGSRVKIIAQIKNTGELASDPSLTLVQMPDGRKHIVKVPRLAAGKTYTAQLSYTLRGYTENIFTVTANYNQKAAEADYENNSTKRSLILPAQ